jgi:transcription elongation factor SPT6
MMEVEAQGSLVDQMSLQNLDEGDVRGDDIEGETENSNKRLREEDDQGEDLFDNLEDEEVENRHRRLKKKKKGSEEKPKDDELNFEDDEIELGAETNPTEEVIRDADEDDEVEAGSKVLGSKQLQSELFADDNDSDEMLQMLPQDFPDDLSEEGINKEARESERRGYVSDEDFSDEERLGDFIVDAQGMPVRMAKEQPRRLGSGAITSEQLGVAHDIFGDYPDELFNDGGADDDEEIENTLSQFNTSELRKESYRILRTRLDPEELDENYATVEDDNIVQTDIPERIQLRTPGRAVPDTEMIAEEAQWIYQMVFAEQLSKLRLTEEVVIECITSVLRLMLVENFEIPFIASYRKEFWNTSNPNPQAGMDEDGQGGEPAVDASLEASHLWDIYDWDEKWFSFQKKKKNVIELYRAVTEQGEVPMDEVSEYIEAISTLTVSEDIVDFLDHHRLHFSQNAQQRSNVKLPNKRDPYSLAKKAGIEEFASKFGITAKQFGENLQFQFANHSPVDHEKSPFDEAFVAHYSGYNTPDDLLDITRFYLATEISNEPRVRQFLRSQFNVFALLNTRPTEEGKRTIDYFHTFRDVKHLENKPIVDMRAVNGFTVRFIKVLKAAKEGLITYTIGLEDAQLEKLIKELKRYYLSSGDPNNEWNTEREVILRLAVTDYLIPLFRSQLEEKLIQEGQQAVLSVCEGNLEKLLLAGPYKSQEQPEGEEEEESRQSRPGISVLACYYGAYYEHKCTECVLLNAAGEYKAHITLAFSPKTRGKDSADFRSFIEMHAPTVIAIGTNGYSSRHLYADMVSILKEMESEGYNVPHASWVDSEVAEIYWSSAQAKDEYAKLGISKVYNSRFARAMSIGRRIIDPLMEFSKICNAKQDICCIVLHPLQQALNQDLLYSRLERVFVSIVNAVGVDINELLRNPRKSHILSFVAGLGPRKSSHLLAEIRSNTSLIYSRTQLIKFIGECVGKNAIGFLKFSKADIKQSRAQDDDNNARYEILDTTRIHPEDYSLANKICKDALDADDDSSGWAEDIMKTPEELDSIDLDKFSDLLEENFESKKKHTLYEIKSELTNPFGDCREVYCDIDHEKLFDLLTGTTNETFYVGMIVKCRITMKPGRNYSRGVNCQLEHSEIQGFIPTNLLSDAFVEHPSDVVQPDETVLGRIVEIDKTRFNVRISCKMSELTSQELNQRDSEGNASGDNYLVEPDNEFYLHPALEEKLVVKEQAKEIQIFKRAIVHPRFRNVDRKGAIAELELDTVPVGFAIIRPSSLDFQHLSLSFKFAAEVFLHIDIQEFDKPNKWSLGKKLKIFEDTYDDLDDVLANCVDPLVNYIESVVSHRRFKAGRRDEINTFLAEAKQQEELPYVLAISYEEHCEGKFQICYQPYNKVVREHVRVTPKGLRYRNQYFLTAQRAIDHFKRHWNDNQTPRYDGQ